MIVFKVLGIILGAIAILGLIAIVLGLALFGAMYSYALSLDVEILFSDGFMNREYMVVTKEEYAKLVHLSKIDDIDVFDYYKDAVDYYKDESIKYREEVERLNKYIDSYSKKPETD